jgi:tetratricopeptide (TPR) repeat protein
MRSIPWRSVVVGLGVLALGSPALAQGARVQGRVLDEEGQAIAGATVTLANPSVGPARTASTNDKGEWAVLGLEAGAWDLDFEAEGYVTRKISVELGSFSNPKPIEIRLERAGPPPELIEAAEKGDAALAAGRFTEAREHYQALLSMRPDLAGTLHLQIARCYKEEGNVEKEIEHLEQAVEADPENSAVRTLLALELIGQGETARGQELLGAVDESAIADPDILYNIGVALLNQGQREAAIDYFTRAVEADPSYTDGYYQRGLTLLGQQKIDEARADFQKVLELAPDGPRAETARKVLEQPVS